MYEIIKQYQQQCFEQYTTTHLHTEEEWRKIITETKKIDNEYILSTVKYHIIYLKQTSNTHDLSIIIYDQNKAIAIWPLNIYYQNNKWSLQSNCKGVIPPFIIDSINRKQRKKILNACIQFINLCNKNNRVENINCHFEPSEDILWNRLLSPYIQSITYRQKLYLHLDKSINELKSNFRKSYIGLINKGKKLWKSAILTSIDQEQIEEIQDFHIKVAGKVTRNKETWQYQKAMFDAKDAFAVTLRDENNELVAAAVFNLGVKRATYSIGIYERTLFDFPLGHVVQMLAIEYMHKQGINEYLIGYRNNHFETPKPIKKETTIGFFKEGFSNCVKMEAIATLSKEQ